MCNFRESWLLTCPYNLAQGCPSSKNDWRSKWRIISTWQMSWSSPEGQMSNVALLCTHSANVQLHYFSHGHWFQLKVRLPWNGYSQNPIKGNTNPKWTLLVLLYLLNLLVVRHQTTACLWETLMSSNRSSTGKWKVKSALNKLWMEIVYCLNI